MNSSKTGNYIKTQLKKKGISQEKLSEMLGISSSAVSQALSGKNSFDIENLQLISDILDESLDVIMNAGEERETRTEKLSKMSLKEFMERDPKFETLKNKDSKGLIIYDYVVKNENIELIRFFQKRGINHHLSSNINYLSLLIKHDEYEILKNIVNHGGKFHKILQETFENLSSDEQELTEALVKSSNPKIHDLFNLIDNQQKLNQIPKIVYHAIEFDKTHFIEKYIENMKDVSGFRDNFQNHFKKQLIKYSILKKSKNCLQFLHKELNRFGFRSSYEFDESNNFTDYFQELFTTKDLEFIKWYQTNFFKNNHSGHYHSDKHHLYKKIHHLIADNNIELMSYAAEFLNQESLDEALYSCKVHQIEMIKVLLSKGARITIVNAYSSRDRIVLEPLTAIIKELFSKLDKKV